MRAKDAGELPVERRCGREEVAVAREAREPRPGGLRLAAARLDDADAPRGTRKLARDRHAGRPGADYADVARDLGAPRKPPRVDDHAVILRDRYAEVQR